MLAMLQDDKLRRISLVTATFCLLIISIEAQQSCKTPNGENVQCVEENGCTVFQNVDKENVRKYNEFVAESKAICESSGSTGGQICCGTKNTYDMIDNAPSKHKNKCVTPNGELGQCIPITKCEALYRVSKENPTDDKRRTFLIQSFCGWLKLPWVCCGPQDNYLDLELYRPPTICYNSSMDQAYTFVGLLQDDNNRTFCTGSLVHVRHVITSAQDKCIGKQVESVLIGNCESGKDNNNECIRLKIAEKIKLHILHYPTKNKHDVALLKLEKDITFNEFIKPVCLTNFQKTIGEGVNMNMIMWNVKSERIEDVKIKALRTDMCIPKNQLIPVNTTKEYLDLCAFISDDNNPEDYSVGSPILVNDTLIGIYSHVFPENPSITVNVRMQTYAPWIRTNILRDILGG